MGRAFFKRSVLSGEELDKSAAPLYLSHVQDMCKSLALSGTREAASRTFAVKCLHQAAGRSGEVAHLSYTRLRWDPYFKCVHAYFAQAKTSKVKIAAFVAGANRHSCCFTDFGDVLATEFRP